jgi:Zn/Cd-binding protein ZinT
VNASRYHLLLEDGGRPVQHGWWDDETVARRKLAAWVGEWGRLGVRVTLVDEETGETLDDWPGVVGGPS